MLESYSNCPLCNSGHFHEKHIIKDFSVSGETFKICQCDECQFLFTNPFPSKDSIGRYYQSNEYISHTDKANNLINLLYKQVRNYTLKQKVNLLDKLEGNTLLDVGCGTGHFLSKAHQHNYAVYGVETEDKARALIPSSIRDKVYSSIDHLPKELNFEIITLWHVLEHLHDLRPSFELLNQRLRKKGYFVIAVPNPNSPDAGHYKNYWAAWDVPRHLYHFQHKQMEQLFKYHNLLLINTLPLYFDAYYVSLLSEKYKEKNLFNQMIFGMIYGFLSNFKASKTEYSSLLYIGQKQ